MLLIRTVSIAALAVLFLAACNPSEAPASSVADESAKDATELAAKKPPELTYWVINKA